MASWGGYQLLIISFVFCSCFNECHSIDDDLNDFHTYRNTFGKTYTAGTAEFNWRFNSYKKTVRRLQNVTTQQIPIGHSVGLTKFSDLSEKEFKDIYLNDLIYIPRKGNFSHATPTSNIRELNIPKKLDWRNQLGYSIVTVVKNQRKCGGCWAFCSVETVESMYGKQRGSPPPDLSVQQVIDCAAGNYGCSGGDPCRALQWMQSTKTPIVTEALYPLTDESNYCRMQPNGTKGVLVEGSHCYGSLVGREDEILQLLYLGPVTVAVDATTWSNYQGGIIQYHCDALNINHAVQIIGYDISGEIPFYIVRNSWGTDFGHDGYMYIKVGNNLCGIASEVGAVRTVA